MSEIIIYTSQDGQIQLDVNLAQETFWLSQQQIAELFGVNRQAITKHLKNIFISAELEEHTASDGKNYKTKFYSLDAVISVGYRVNSLQATQFRIWASNVLKQHLVKGYTTYSPRLAQQGLHELEQTVALLEKTLKQHELVSDIGSDY